MNIALIGLITVAFGALATFRSSTAALTILCCASLLAAASAISIGGANITPGHLAVLFFGLAVIIRQDPISNMTSSMVQGRPGIYLVALGAWAFTSGFLLPRVFAGQFMVYPLNSPHSFILQEPLRPVGSNFNQAVFFLAGPAVFALVSSIARSPIMLRRVAQAIIIASVVNLVFVALDTITFAIGMSALLDFVRNGDYGQLFSHKLMGIKRVTGTFPEASSFAGASAMLFAFNFRLWRGGLFPRITGWVSLLTFVAILFSFSSTGYGALMVYLSLAYAGVISGLERQSSADPQARVHRSIFVSLLPGVAFAGAIIIALKPDLLDPVFAIFDNSITSKLQSSSGVERGAWNAGGIEAFLKTYGLGAGTGAVRTSSFVVAILANMGIVGAVLFGLFFFKLFRSKPEIRFGTADHEMRQYAAAARAACFIGLVGASVAAASVSLNSLFYVFAGLACSSVFYQRRAPRPVQAAPPAQAAHLPQS